MTAARVATGQAKAVSVQGLQAAQLVLFAKCMMRACDIGSDVKHPGYWLTEQTQAWTAILCCMSLSLSCSCLRAAASAGQGHTHTDAT